MVLRIERYLDAVVIVNDDTGRVVWKKLHAFGKGDEEFGEAENVMDRMIMACPAPLPIYRKE